jgi:histidine triad (HIT) family protein
VFGAVGATMTYDPQNIFAKILRKEIPCNMVYEDDVVLAFRDITPAAPVHVLVISKRAAVSFNDFVVNALEGEVEAFFAAVQKVAAQEGVESGGYRLITNHGANASQSVGHFHVHLLAGKPLGGLLVDDTQLR